MKLSVVADTPPFGYLLGDQRERDKKLKAVPSQGLPVHGESGQYGVVSPQRERERGESSRNENKEDKLDGANFVKLPYQTKVTTGSLYI